MTARQDTYYLMRDLNRDGLDVSFEDANTLSRTQITLHRWAELKCGSSDRFKSWAIERDEITGKPFMGMHPHDRPSYRYAIPDREAGALKRVAAICAKYGAYFYHQTDPRGSALRISSQPIPKNDYTRAVAV